MFRRLRKFIYDKSPIYVMATSGGALGNTIEEIVFGFLHARRVGKKILLLRRYSIFGRPRLSNRELFGLQSVEPLSRIARIMQVTGNTILTVLDTYGPATARYVRINSERLLTYGFALVRYHLSGRIGPKPRFVYRHQRNLFYTFSIGTPWLYNPDWHETFTWPAVWALEWEKTVAEPIGIQITAAKLLVAKEIQSRMGLPADAWWVCLHVREGGYNNDAGNPRNTNILNCVGAIEAITAQGGWVIRMGDNSMTRLPQMERVIDYPHTEFKSELMDLYLVQDCRLYVGTCSGMLDLAHAFEKPTVVINAIDWCMIFGYRVKGLAVLQHVFSRRLGRFLSVAELLIEPHFCLGLERWDTNYFFIENSPDEIRDVVLEALDSGQCADYTLLQQEFMRRRKDQITCWIDQGGTPGGYELDVFAKFRFASRVIVAPGSLGKRFLEQHWDKNQTPVPVPLPSAPGPSDAT